jgi:O-antigen/teichoic acid export membrane protein
MMLAQLVTWALTLLLTVVMPRFLGPEVYGEFSIASAVWSIAAIFMVCGMDTMLLNAVSRDRAAPRELMGTVLWWRVLLYPVAAAAVTGYLWLSGFSGQTVRVVHLLGIATLAWMVVSLLQAVLQGLERMEYIALGTIAGKLANTALGITVLLLGFGIYGVVVVAIVAACISMLIEMRFLAALGALHLKPDTSRVWPVVRASAPFMLSQIVVTTYLQINTLVIATLLDKTEVGWYGVATQVFGTLLFLPVAVSDALFPVFSRLHARDPGRLPRVLRRGLEVIVMAGVPAGLGLTAVAPALVELVFGSAFAPGGAVLQVLGVALTFMYTNILLARFLSAVDRPLAWTRLMGVALPVLVSVSILAVPACQARFGNGAVGGAIAFLVAEMGMTLVGLTLLPRGTLDRALLWKTARILLCGLATAFVAWRLRSAFVAVPVAAGAVTYLATLLALRVPSREDWELVRDLTRGVLRRLRRPSGGTAPDELSGKGP